MKPSTFYAAHLQATFGGWVLFRDGMFVAAPFTDQRKAKEHAESICQAEGIEFNWEWRSGSLTNDCSEPKAKRKQRRKVTAVENELWAESELLAS